MNHCLELDLLAEVFVRIISRIDIEQAEVLFIKGDERAICIKRKLRLLFISVCNAVLIFKYNLSTSVNSSDTSSVFSLLGIFVAAIEDDHIRILQLIHDDLLHVVDINVKG